MDETKVRRVLGLSSTVNLMSDPYAAANRRISILVLSHRAERRMDAEDATYATNAELNKILGGQGEDELGVRRGEFQPFDPEQADPDSSAAPGGFDPMMHGEAPSVPPQAEVGPSDGPLAPRPGGSGLVETAIPMPASAGTP